MSDGIERDEPLPPARGRRKIQPRAETAAAAAAARFRKVRRAIAPGVVRVCSAMRWRSVGVIWLGSVHIVRRGRLNFKPCPGWKRWAPATAAGPGLSLSSAPTSAPGDEALASVCEIHHKVLTRPAAWSNVWLR